MRNGYWYLPFLLGGALTVSSCQKDTSSDPLIEEFAKHDPWVEIVMQDQVKVRVLDPDEMSLEDRFGFVETDGSFDMQSDILFLPRDGGFSDQTLDAIDHELAHALIDTVGMKGLIFQSGFQGPSFDEINQYMYNVYEGEDFDSLRTWLNDEGIGWGTLKRMMDIKSFVEAYADHQIIIREIDEYYEENAKFEAYLKDQDLMKKRQSIQSKLESIALLCRSVTLPDSDEIKKRYFRRLVDVQADKILQNEQLFEEIDQYCDDVFSAFDFAQKTFYESRIGDLEELMRKGDDRERYLVMLENIQREYADVRDGQEAWFAWTGLRRNLASASYKLSRFMNEQEYLFSVESSEGVMYNSMEVFARMIDSLYSMYYGRPSLLKFPLSDADLDFLGTFTFEGKQMFRKGIERYCLGRRMLADGVPEETVKRLEHAESFTYRGNAYFWPKSNVKGAVRYISLLDKMKMDVDEASSIVDSLQTKFQ